MNNDQFVKEIDSFLAWLDNNIIPDKSIMVNEVNNDNSGNRHNVDIPLGDSRIDAQLVQRIS